jgi:hypothetical protein
MSCVIGCNGASVFDCHMFDVIADVSASRALVVHF